MGRVPALRAESIFYWIRQEKRKRRDALAKLESKIIYFYTEAKMNVKVEDEDHANLPPLPINEMRVEKEDEKDADWDEELTHWYNNENNIHKNNFQPPPTRSPDRTYASPPNTVNTVTRQPTILKDGAQIPSFLTDDFGKC